MRSLEMCDGSTSTAWRGVSLSSLGGLILLRQKRHRTETDLMMWDSQKEEMTAGFLLHSERVTNMGRGLVIWSSLFQTGVKLGQGCLEFSPNANAFNRNPLINVWKGSSGIGALGLECSRYQDDHCQRRHLLRKRAGITAKVTQIGRQTASDWDAPLAQFDYAPSPSSDRHHNPT